MNEANRKEQTFKILVDRKPHDWPHPSSPGRRSKSSPVSILQPMTHGRTYPVPRTCSSATI